jgi:hypothetical protein
VSVHRLSRNLAALADALQISVSELTKLPVPALANGPTDSAIKTVRSAMRAVSHGRPSGQVLPVEVLRARVMATVDMHCRCDREREVGAALPGLIRDLHSSIVAGRDVAAELLPTSGFPAIGEYVSLSSSYRVSDRSGRRHSVRDSAGGDCGHAGLC